MDRKLQNHHDGKITTTIPKLTIAFVKFQVNSVK